MASNPRLIKEWRGFNIVKFQDHYWGIPQSLGDVDLTQSSFQQVPSLLKDNSPEKVRHKIDDLVDDPNIPLLIEEWKTYNIVKYQKKYWGIPQSLGDVDLTQSSFQQVPSLLKDNSPEKVRHKIDDLVDDPNIPLLIEEWNTYNIVKYQKKYWGIPQSLGDVDLTQSSFQQVPSLLKDNSPEKVRHKIDDLVDDPNIPLLIEEWNTYNIVKYQKIYWAIPQSLGDVDLNNLENNSHSLIISEKNLEKLKERITHT
ncbi:hypothetical protein ACTRW9_10740 [Nitrospina sp. 32_T5]|uniref:hypothetical protein n=1 Tax=unclassified Nitrospina TaxID=2638683 RepID=UPI003F95DE27